MARVGTVGRVGAVQVRPPRPAEGRSDPAPTGRALAVIAGGRPERPPGAARGGRADAAFLAQLLAAVDPTLRPSRAARAGAAASVYAEAARRSA